MKLKKENEDPCKALFLDLSIEVHDRMLTTELTDKRDAFLFYINRTLNLDCNIPSKILYTSIGTEILHIVRITPDLINMVAHVTRAVTDKKVFFTRIILLLKQIL